MGVGSLRARREADDRHDHVDEPHDAATPAHVHPVSPAQPASPDQLSYLQSTGGNAMVMRMLQRAPADPAATDTPAPAPAPAVDIAWIKALPGHIQGQIDMFQ